MKPPSYLGLVLGLMLLGSVSASAGDDPGRGAELYDRCLACHALTYNRTGPKHCGLFGRRAGGVEGFDYSDAMARSGIVWDADSLDRFLTDPLTAVPGTTMTYDGVKDSGERADLIAFLQAANGPGGRCAQD